MNKTAIIIPSHLASKRLPNKPLLEINNKSMILHVWERAKKSNVCDIFVTTPDEDIANEIKTNGGHVIITGNHHTNGSDRICEALNKLNLDLLTSILLYTLIILDIFSFETPVSCNIFFVVF